MYKKWTCCLVIANLTTLVKKFYNAPSLGEPICQNSQTGIQPLGKWFTGQPTKFYVKTKIPKQLSFKSQLAPI